jgi:hypothetical protein
LIERDVTAASIMEFLGCGEFDPDIVRELFCGVELGAFTD